MFLCFSNPRELGCRTAGGSKNHWPVMRPLTLNNHRFWKTEGKISQCLGKGVRINDGTVLRIALKTKIRVILLFSSSHFNIVTINTFILLDWKKKET